MKINKMDDCTKHEEDRKLVSIIVPVYNVECILRIFRKTIDSVLNQTYKNIELVLVNDGSTDSTFSILNHIREKDSRIRVFHKSNGGVESARRYGLSVCTGTFIMHMDQDDLLHQSAVENHYIMITVNNADITVAESRRFIWNKYISKKTNYFKENIIVSNCDLLEKYYIGFFGRNFFPINIWNKMYRKSFLDSIPEPPCTGLINEDLMYNMHVFPYAKKVIFMNEILYYYRWGGFTSRYDRTLLDTAISCYLMKMKQIEKMNLSDRFKSSVAIEYLNYLNTYFYQEVAYNNSSKEDFYKLVKEVMEQLESKCAISTIQQLTEYRNDHINVMINKDYNTLYDLEHKKSKKNRYKILIKNILLK